MATQSRRAGWGYGLALAGLAGALFVGLSSYMRSLERKALSHARINEQLTAAGEPRPLAEVARAIQQMKLVTVEVQSSVTAETGQKSWRGDVGATVEAPVRLLYGTDLSKMNVQSLAASPLGGLLVRIPRPERIATEVCGDAESVNVDVGWMRLRSRAGEYYLGLARRDLFQRARELTLSPKDARKVRETTLKQTEDLIRKVLPPSTPVAVVFEDGEP